MKDSPNKGMQPDQNARYALILTADAKRYILGVFMRFLLFSVLALVVSTGAFANEAADLRLKGVQAASTGDYTTAQKHLRQSAELGYYTAQVEYAYLLESSPENIQNKLESYAWYNVVITQKGTDTVFAKEGLARLSKLMSVSEIEHAKQLTAKYIEQYAK